MCLILQHYRVDVYRCNCNVSCVSTCVTSTHTQKQ